MTEFDKLVYRVKKLVLQPVHPDSLPNYLFIVLGILARNTPKAKL